MNVLIVTSTKGCGSRMIGADMVDAFQELGVSVTEYDFEQLIQTCLSKNPSSKLPAVLDALNGDLVELCRQKRFDLMLIIALAPVIRYHLEQIRKLGIKMALWWVENFRIFEQWKQYIDLIDWTFVIQPGLFERVLDRLEVKNAYLPTAFNPNIEFDAKQKRTCPVAFVGSAYPNRIPVMEKLVAKGIPVTIWGHLWDEKPISQALQSHLGEPKRWLAPKEFADTFRNAKITINLHSSLEAKDEIHLRGDFLNRWVFSIPACGSFQIVDRRPLVKRFYSEGQNIECYASVDELAEKIEFYLANTEKVSQMVTAAQQTVLAQHSYTNRAHSILELVS